MKYDENINNATNANIEERIKDYDKPSYGEKADSFYNGNEGKDVLRAAWNLFGLTGSIEEYMLVKEIEKIRNSDK